MGRTNWEDVDDHFKHRILVPAWQQLLDEELQLLRMSYDFCRYGHTLDTPVRKTTGEAYHFHPLAVAEIFLTEIPLMDAEILYISLLHDILEDTDLLSVDHLQRVFGRNVAHAVKILSKNDFKEQIRQAIISKEDGDRLYFERIQYADNWRATVVKLGDRLHNLRTAESLSDESLHRLIDTTQQQILPLVAVACKQAPTVKHDRITMLGELLEAALAHIAYQP